MSRLVLACAVAAAVAWVPAARAGGVPVQMAVAGDTLWATSDAGLSVVDLRGGRILRRPATTYPYAMWVAAGGVVWVGSITNGYLAGAVDRFGPHGRTTGIRSRHGAVYALAYGAGRIWATFELNGDTVVRGAERPVTLAGAPGWVAADARGLWTADEHGLWLVRPDGRVFRVPGAPPSTSPVAAGDGSVWELTRRRVLRYDAASRRLRGVETFAGYPILVAAAHGREWTVVENGDGSELLARGGRSRRLRFVPTDLRYAAGRLWLGRSGYVGGKLAPPAVVEVDPASLRTLRTIPLG
jgi:ligand-binding sensor domain-containing protein